MLGKLIKFIIPLLVISCHDEASQVGETDNQQRAVTIDVLSPDIFVVTIPDITVDAYVDPCEGVQNTDENYCQCYPRCCQQQTWYCPPRGTEILAKEAILDICDNDYVPCDRNRNDQCPPAEILSETGCNHAFDCPPGISDDFTMYYNCEIEGIPGTQKVVCDKGRLSYDECITCYIEDEVCDGQDNDCDGNVDEHQLNACGECGPLQTDTCDGLDNDCDGLIDEELSRECVTDCERGIEVCQEGNWIGCTARQPQEETCDGLDGDCDGIADEGLTCNCPPEMIGALIPCMERPLVCGAGFKTCECQDDDCTTTAMTDCFALCYWLPPESINATCDELAGMPVFPEMCNNYDEDCDTNIDESLVKTCYSGPEGTAGTGVCRQGSQACMEGQWYGETTSGSLVLDFCAGEVLPSREVCDGSDNDCDGVSDFGQELPDTDILFIVDWSSSMESNIRASLMAMSRFANNFSGQEKLQWGLITGPKVLQANTQTNYLKLETDITDFVSFINAFQSAGSILQGASHEMLMDALYLAVRTISNNLQYDLSTSSWVSSFTRVESIPPLEDFRVNWREDADRVIVLFTDEENQTFLRPALRDQHLLDALASSPDTKLYVFAKPYLDRYWQNYVSVTGGQMFNLSTSADVMYNDLMSILDEICLSAAEARITMEPQYLPASYGSRYDFNLGLCY